MGTTRIKVIDLSSEQKEIKTSRKHAKKLSGTNKIKGVAKPENLKPDGEEQQKPATTESTEKPGEHPRVFDDELRRIGEVEASPGKHPGGESRSKATTTSTRHASKKYKQAANLIDKNKAYPTKEAIELLNKTSYTKFDPTVEIHLNVAEKNIRGNVNLPHPFGKKKQRVSLIFTDKKIPDIKNVIVGNDKTIEKIQNGTLKPVRDFDAVFAQPKFMVQLVKVAKILGPKGMMPNPKDKTISDSPEEILQKTEGKESFEYRTDPTAAVIHSTLGKLSSKPEFIEENLKALVLAIGTNKIKKAVIKSTMSPAIRVDAKSLAS